MKEATAKIPIQFPVVKFSSRFQNLTGMVFGRITVLEHAGKNWRGIHLWKCKCSCGNEKIIPGGNLRNGITISCGCYYRQCLKTRLLKHGHSPSEGGFSPEYRTWNHIKTRCHNPKSIGYQNYGGRGIRVCRRWRNSFILFLKDVGLKPSPFHSIDRINPNGNYEPGNCRWATAKEQANNKRNNRLITIDGKTLNLAQWVEKMGISRNVIRQRLERGWDAKSAIMLPLFSHRNDLKS